MQFIDVILAILNFVIVLLTLFLIGIILIQRGKGGGLAGAFGGMGGSSAFGTKTGDVFTKITVGVAIAWILLSMLMVVLTNRRNGSALGDDDPDVAHQGARFIVEQVEGQGQVEAAGGRTRPSTSAECADDGLPPIDIPALPDVRCRRKARAGAEVSLRRGCAESTRHLATAVGKSTRQDPVPLDARLPCS